MISPVFNPASSGRLQEAVDFDFTKVPVDPRISVARAGDDATLVNSSGRIERALADTARSARSSREGVS